MATKFCPYCGHRITISENEPVTSCPNCKAELVSTFNSQSMQPDKLATEQVETNPQNNSFEPQPSNHDKDNEYSQPLKNFKHPETPEGPAWEENGNFFTAFFKTTFQSLFKPYLTFIRPYHGSSVRFFWFFFLCLLFGLAIDFLYSPYFQYLETSYIILIYGLGLLISPLSLIIGGAYIHLFLKTFGAGGNGIKATIRITAYSSTIFIFNLIPLIGNIVGLIWSFTILVNGTAAAHQSTRAKTFLALLSSILAPIVLFSLLLYLLSSK